jgi:photosystem II stability/assembly factor-like uncharacterized protein
VDQHGFVQTSAGTFFATDGGVYRSTDRGSTFSFAGHGLATVQFHAGSLGRLAGSVIVGGTQDNGVVFTTATTGWTSALGGDGTAGLVDPGNDQNLFADVNEASTFFSTDGGRNWTPSSQGPGQDNADLLAPMVLRPGTSGSSLTLYVGTTSLWRSNDAMRSWQRRGAPLPFDTFRHLAANASGRLLASDGSRYATSPDEGHTWQENSPLPCAPGCDVTDVAIASSGSLYVTANTYPANTPTGHVYRSTNNGLSWSEIGSPELSIPLHAITVDPNQGSTIYVGGLGGVFLSDDQGTSWQRLGAGLPGAAVYHLSVARDSSVLAAFTLGRGVWELQL